MALDVMNKAILAAEALPEDNALKKALQDALERGNYGDAISFCGRFTSSRAGSTTLTVFKFGIHARCDNRVTKLYTMLFSTLRFVSLPLHSFRCKDLTGM